GIASARPYGSALSGLDDGRCAPVAAARRGDGRFSGEPSALPSRSKSVTPFRTDERGGGSIRSKRPEGTVATPRRLRGRTSRKPGQLPRLGEGQVEHGQDAVLHAHEPCPDQRHPEVLGLDPPLAPDPEATSRRSPHPA